MKQSYVEINEQFKNTLEKNGTHQQDLSILTNAQIVLQASLARKAGSQPLDFHRIDYPELDPPEWAKFITIKLEKGKVKIGGKSFDYAGNLKEQYEAHNKDYTGVYTE